MVVLEGKIAFRGPPTECGLLGLSGIPPAPSAGFGSIATESQGSIGQPHF